MRGSGELLLFILFTGKAFDHAHRADVFLHGFVETVVLAEHRAEGGHGLACDEKKADHQHGNDDKKGRCERTAHDIGHDDGKEEHQRGAHGDADAHHERHLHVAHVGGHARDERSGGKLVDIFKGEALHAGEDVVADVFGKPGARARAEQAAERTAAKRHKGHQNEHKTHADNAAERCAVFDLIDEIGCEKRDQHLNRDLADHAQKRQDGRLFVFADTAHEAADHFHWHLPPLLRGGGHSGIFPCAIMRLRCSSNVS